MQYDLKVAENSNTNIKSYVLEYYYFYVLKSAEDFTIEQDKDFVLECYFELKNFYYLIFWTKKEKHEIKMATYTKPIYITYYLIKTEDSYMIGKDRVLKNINDIMHQQYLDVSYKKYKYKQIMSSVWFNLLTSNKLLYNKYLINEGLMINSEIKNISLDKINSYSNQYVIKAPYSSASYCVTYATNMKKSCFIGEGVIVSKRNTAIKDVEIKIHTCYGEILFCNIKSISSFEFTLDANLQIVRNELVKDITDDELKKE